MALRNIFSTYRFRMSVVGMGVSLVINGVMTPPNVCIPMLRDAMSKSTGTSSSLSNRFFAWIVAPKATLSPIANPFELQIVRISGAQGIGTITRHTC